MKRIIRKQLIANPLSVLPIETAKELKKTVVEV